MSSLPIDTSLVQQSIESSVKALKNIDTQSVEKAFQPVIDIYNSASSLVMEDPVVMGVAALASLSILLVNVFKYNSEKSNPVKFVVGLLAAVVPLAAAGTAVGFNLV